MEKNHIGIQEDDDDPGKVVVYEGGAGVAIGGPCQPLDYAEVCSVNAAGVRVDLGDGDNWGYVSLGLPASLRVSITGGAGNDKLQADVQDTTLDGGAGYDRMEDDWEADDSSSERPVAVSPHGPTRTVKLRRGGATLALGRLSHGRHRVSVTPRARTARRAGRVR